MKKVTVSFADAKKIVREYLGEERFHIKNCATVNRAIRTIMKNLPSTKIHVDQFGVTITNYPLTVKREGEYSDTTMMYVLADFISKLGA